MSATLLLVYVGLYIVGLFVTLVLPWIMLSLASSNGRDSEEAAMRAAVAGGSCVCCGCLMMIAALVISIIAFIYQVRSCHLL